MFSQRQAATENPVLDPIWVERNDFLPPPVEFRNDVRLHRGAYPHRSDGRAGVSLREHVGAGLAGGDREVEGVELTVVSVSRCPGEAPLGGRGRTPQLHGVTGSCVLLFTGPVSSPLGLFFPVSKY